MRFKIPVAFAILLIASLAARTQSPNQPPLQSGVASNQNFFSSGAYCYTPARDAKCSRVRFGWTNCPGSRQACDTCYGPNGIFAYTPRSSTYTLASGCDQLGSSATWNTQNSQIKQWMQSAGGNCTSDGRGGYNCTGVDPKKFTAAAKAN